MARQGRTAPRKAAQHKVRVHKVKNARQERMRKATHDRAHSISGRGGSMQSRAAQGRVRRRGVKQSMAAQGRTG